MEDRYSRIRETPEIGPEGLEKIRSKRVAVVGCGSLGCAAIAQLCLLGFGHLRLIDPDRIQTGNLNRQWLYHPAQTGARKVEKAAEWIRLMNPELHVETFPELLTRHNALHLLEHQDLVLDCTDQLQTRYHIDSATEQLGIPWIYAGIFKHQAMLSTFMPGKGNRFAQIFPDISGLNTGEHCNNGFTPGTLTTATGCLQAHEALQIVCNPENTLTGQLLVIDWNNKKMDKIQL